MQCFQTIILLSMGLLAACSGETASDGGGSGGSGGGAGGGDQSYICYPEKPCDSVDMSCKTDPANPDSGLLICDGDDFVTTCEVGYFCSNDGSTPEQFPGCTSKSGTDLTCDIENDALAPIDTGAGGAGGSAEGGGGSGGSSP